MGRDNNMNNKKIKSNSGSALVLAILCVALVSIVVSIVSFQLNNQIKSNKRSYDGMKYKYAAEAGFEKAIYDIENDIINKVPYRQISLKSKNHNDCPKVEFINGQPVLGDQNQKGNTFKYLILNEMIINGSDKIHNDLFGSNLSTVLGWDHPLIGVGHVAKTYYDHVILQNIKYISSGHLVYNAKVFESDINYFMNMMDTIITDVSKSTNGSKEMREKLIQKAELMKEYMIEIKCRLGLYVEEDSEETSIKIKIPSYNVIIKNESLDIKESGYDEVEILVNRNSDGTLESIDLSEIKEKDIISSSLNYKAMGNIEFDIEKYNDRYDVTYKIKSYDLNIK